MAPVGCGTALVTPFRADGALDEPALRALVDWQIGTPIADPATPGTHTGTPEAVETASLTGNTLRPGVDFLLACGTTGETPTLSHPEWLAVLRIVADQSAGRVPVWAGATSNSTREAVALAQEAATIPGITAVLSANPPYNKPSQAGQYEHFAAIARAIEPFPLVVYNIPGRSGANLEPATVARLAHDFPNIVGIKESSGSLGQITELLTLVPRSFSVYCGDDPLALGCLGAGSPGLISVASNVLPREMATLVHSALANDWARARSINHSVYPLLLAHFLEPNPSPVKALLAMMGRIHETYRLPMMPVSETTRGTLRALAQAHGLLPEVKAAAAS